MDGSSDSPLLIAAHAKDLTLLRWLVDNHVNVNAAVSDDDAFTALHAAVSTRVEMYDDVTGAPLPADAFGSHPHCLVVLLVTTLCD